jgi:hypothetical protein
MRQKGILTGVSGQTVVEYMVLLSVVIGIYKVARHSLQDTLTPLINNAASSAITSIFKPTGGNFHTYKL